jgi:hypothetical protein
MAYFQPALAGVGFDGVLLLIADKMVISLAEQGKPRARNRMREMVVGSGWR